MNFDPRTWAGWGGMTKNDVRATQTSQSLAANSDAARDFANAAQGNYNMATDQLQGTYGQLGEAMKYQQGLARGENSVSAEQLRQSLQQNLAAQRSMAAAASPNNAAMAARTAAMQQGKLGSGLAGQQATAGLQERNQAMTQYGQLGGTLGQLQLGVRGQDVNAALGARQSAINAQAARSQIQNPDWFENLKKAAAAGGAAGMGG
jgi:hypothetical protein